ncbi:MAG TPA: PfkB family carbohydrate kinase [Anaerolineales bacterium]|nr:PfkB family carbohydrate kinase [Anaerolineales bacterium]
MFNMAPLEPVDYLVLGHITEDMTPSGPRLGGTAVFSALTARALGLRVGLVTSASEATPLDALSGVYVVRSTSPHTTTFENIKTANGRIQILHRQASPIPGDVVPGPWRRAPIVHLGPIVHEVDPACASLFSEALLGVTPQGWMRTWDEDGRIWPQRWDSAETLGPQAGAVVISREDVGGDEEVIEALAHHTRVLVVTEGPAGCLLYWNGDRRRFHALEMAEVDTTGAGDIFAAAFFARLYATRDPWEAARFATRLASYSVARSGLDAIPNRKEIEESSMEVLH